MDVIRNYLDSMFINIPQTEAMLRVKEDLFNNMEDRYNELIADEINHNEAVGTVLAEFGNVDELLEELEIEKNLNDSFQEDGPLPVITESKATEFMNFKRKFSLYISLGVAVIILGISALLSLQIFLNSHGGIIGTAAFFIFIGIGVGLIIYGGVSSGKYENLEKGFILPQTVRHFIEIKKNEFSSSFRFGITIGVLLCISSIACIMVSSIFSAEQLGTAGMFVFVAAGVFLLIYVGIIQSSFTFLLENGLRSQPSESDQKKKIAKEVVTTTWWIGATVLYLFISFAFSAWAWSWIIWVLAGTCSPLIDIIFKSDQS